MAAGAPSPWLQDVLVEVAPLETTGGKVWSAAHELCAFLERRAAEVGLSCDGAGDGGGVRRVLEIGAGCGWLGMCLARNVPGAEVCLSEQPAGMEHLRRNIDLNRVSGLPGLGALRAAALDWGDLCGASGLLEERWDLVIGSDLLYSEQGLSDLPRLFGRLAGDATRVLYAHTLHRYDHLDVEFFKALEAAGLECREVGDVPPEGEAFLEELFPEERPAVFELRRRRGAGPRLLEAKAKPDRSEASARPPSSSPPAEAMSRADRAADLGLQVLLPGEEEVGTKAGLPLLRLAVVGPFGNAGHPTTRLVLRWMSSPAGRAALHGRRVCDYGCGSGILGLAALRHGAASCAAVDNDVAALAAARANAEANALSLEVHLPPAEVLDRDLDFFSRFGDWRARGGGWSPLPPAGDAGGAGGGGPFPAVLCNIVVGPLCRVAPTLHGLCASGGVVVLAGFRGSHMRGQVEDAYGGFFELSEAGQEDGWLLLVGRRRPSPP